MTDTAYRALAIVGVSAVLPDAPDAATFWRNVRDGRYSIGEVDPKRWDPALYYDPDPSVPDKTYSKLGGFVRDWDWDPMGWRLPIPPKVADSMDEAQKWAIACARAVLLDFGWPDRKLDLESTAVVLGNAMSGEQHYLTALRIHLPRFEKVLAEAPSFEALPADVRRAITGEVHERFADGIPNITEDTMPGELSNVMAGRIANLFDLHGPNFVCDAACAAALSAIDAAADGLIERQYDAVIVGGVDRNMGPEPYVKFSKIGALSATGTRPYAEGADGFVMGEGASFFVLKRLADAERDGDRIYAVLRGIGGASDGKGKGITAPNPKGQQLAIQRAWRRAGLSPAGVGLIEGHGTSTRVGDVVEVQSLNEIFGNFGLPPRSVPLGSVKSNIGHLKGAAGAAGLLKTVMALHEKELPPSLGFGKPNPNIDFDATPFYVNTESKPWDAPADGVRRAGVSAFGFGGTNFHAVLEEHLPGRLTSERTVVPVSGLRTAPADAGVDTRPPPRGALVLGEHSVDALRSRLEQVLEAARQGTAPPPRPPVEADLRAPERLVIDYGDAAELASRAERALKALAADAPNVWNAVRAQGVFRGCGAAPKIAFLYTGQGSQYPNMLRELREREPIVRETFAEADRVMSPHLPRPLSEYIFPDPADEAAVKQADAELRRTEITQPAVLTVDTALTRMLASYGIVPDVVMGHSLGEYGALVAAGALPFEDALLAVSARGREMADLEVEDVGRMAAVLAPLETVQEVVDATEGNVVVANVNSRTQAVIGGATEPVTRAIAAFEERELRVVPLNVSHAFHTTIVAPASEPLRRTLEGLRLAAPEIPLVGNVHGTLYPTGPDARERILDLLAEQVASPVQFVKGLETLYAEGVRVALEVGPKKALHGFASDVLGDREDFVALFSNHPKVGDIASLNQALCGCWAAGLGLGTREEEIAEAPAPVHVVSAPLPAAPPRAVTPAVTLPTDRYTELGRLFAEFLDRGQRILGAGETTATPGEPSVVTGVGLGLPGGERVFDDTNVERILDGRQAIDVIPSPLRAAMVDKHITRLVKGSAEGPHFEAISGQEDVIKLAARAGAFDIESEFGVSGDRVPALDRVTQLAMAAGIEALRDAGIPLVQRYRTTTKGTFLPERWMLPDALRDETGVIFAAAFPGYDAFANELTRYHQDRGRRTQAEALESVRARAVEEGGEESVLVRDLDHRLHELHREIDENAYEFDRRFLFRVLPMGHSQFAEYIGARGPNTHINSACASTTQAFALAEDWIRSGRCRRVVVIAADDATGDDLLEWIGAGFLATGAAATDEVVENAALPFDRRRHGMILGMGAVGIVVEQPSCAAERGLAPLCEVLSTVTANSAFHGTRLDVEHIESVMERVIAQAEQRFGLDRAEIARELLFVSHETYTPARGGSASAEVHALRRVFGDAADAIVVANTKGLTGHPMGVGIEDAVAITALETGIVPPVPNFREPDPELGPLHLSRGGAYPIRYALRLGAGFGSQISLTLLRQAAPVGGQRPEPDARGFQSRLADEAGFARWLGQVSGDAEAELEVVDRTLRVVDRGPMTTARAARAAAAAPTPVAPTKAATAPASPTTAAPVAAAAPAPVAPPEPTTAAAPAGDDDEAEVRARVLAIVAEKTGYPEDMLDLDLDLEADLGIDTVKQAETFGIDTVKQAETFAAIREGWGIPRDENLQLRDYPTLAHAVQFVLERRPGGPPATESPSEAAAPQPGTDAPQPSAAAPAGDDDEAEVRARVLAIVAEKTGYPEDMLDLDLDLEADLGIDTVKQAETFENLQLRDYPTLAHAVRFVLERRPAAPAAEEAVAEAESKTIEEPASGVRLRVPSVVPRPDLSHCKPTGVTLDEGQRVVLLSDRGGVGRALGRRLEQRGVTTLALEPELEPSAVSDRVEAWRQEGPIHGVYWLPALDAAGEASALSPDEWREGLRVRVKLLYATARALYEELGEAGRFFVSATRLGGCHGYDDEGALHPMGGAVVGFTKALARERPEALAKAVDFPATRKTAELADALIAETLSDPGCVEVGVTGSRRVAVGLCDVPASAGGGVTLGPDTVALVTGAAGGIVSAITGDLARGGVGTFHLLDLSPAPDPDDPDVAQFDEDREALKRVLFERLKEGGGRVTPVQVERELARVERLHEAAAALRAITAAGGRAHWHQVDLTDADAVAKVIERVREESGRIDVLLHAAGLEVSRPLPDKKPEEFDRVFDVKCDGWFHLLRATQGLPLGAVVLFSSIAGRFGNAGQTDYSAANDLLCKFASSLRRSHPETRAFAVDWTAWAQIGMASRGSIPEIMARAGIDMMAPEDGVPLVRRLLERGGDEREFLAAGELGVLLTERDETGGLAPPDAAQQGPMVGRADSLGVWQGLHVVTRLDPTEQPFLNDHRIDGTAVLPGVMGVEAFVEAARLPFPELPLAAVEDVTFAAPFKFYRDEPREVEILADFALDGDDVVADCRLVGQRQLPGRDEPQVTTHFTARVRLGPREEALETRAPAPGAEGAVLEAADLYGVYFHGPAYQVVGSAWHADGSVVARLAEGLPANHTPAERPLATRPRLLELCFQAAGAQEIATTGRMGLPQRIARVRFASGERDGANLGDAKKAYAVVAAREPGAAADVVVLDPEGHVQVQLEGYETAALPVPLDAPSLREALLA
jgi:acyl transferase domain-containing protein/NAD(P)-dependent dehydrogenase (short-subunit alcohol dehydrogenase family)